MTADLDLDLAEARFRRRRIARFAPESLLWLAVLPEWTERRAAAAGFPCGDRPLPELLDRLDSAGLLARRTDIDGDGELLAAFWLPASRRAEVGAHLRSVLRPAQVSDGLRELTEVLRRLPGDDVGTWLQVAARHLDDPSGVELLADVERLVTSGRAAEALGVVGAAQALGDVLGEPLASSARRAQWRIDRAHRQALDARTVAHYLPHPHVDEAVRDLLDGDGTTWALHLLGDGGVGKTMAVRDLSSGRFAARCELPQPPVARVDFDHLDPRYPYGRPGELLLAFVGELFTYSSTREAESAFRASDDALALLHETVAVQAPGAVDPQLLDAAVAAFADLLNGLGGGVVLVLDTCEELAKLHPPGGRAPAVDRTFELLERLHRLSPSMRVILAGRRRLVPSPEGRDSGGLVLDPRPYLRVVPLGGFSAEQARQYLDRRDPGGVLAPPLREAVLARSTGGDGANPYDLACYCDWALSEPDLDAATLRDAPGDPYVEQRILARLSSSEARDSLAVAVELGRFDRAMIEPALRSRGIDVDAAFSGLVGQEWVSAVTFDADGRPGVVEVDEQLRPRLRAVLAAQPGRFPLDPAQLAGDLQALVIAAPLPELAVEAVEAALRLLPPIEAGRMWQGLAERIATAPGGWDWALQATTRAGATEAVRATGGGPTVQGAILATQAAAQLRLPGRAPLGPLWRQVLELAARHPDPVVARELEFRALCGRIGDGDGDRGAVERISDLWAAHHDALPADSLLAALEATDDLPALLSGRAPVDVAPEIVSAVRLEHVRERIRHDELDGAAAVAEEVLADVVEPTTASDRLPGRRAPARPRERARLARLVVAMARGEPPDGLPLGPWREEALEHVTDTDAERLVAATIVLELAWRPVDLATVRPVVDLDGYRPDVPTQFWHRAVPPLYVALARALAAAGDAPAAAQLLRRRRDDAVAAGEDPRTIEVCEIELAELSRIFRSLGFTTSIGRIARTGAASDPAWAALALVRGESPALPGQTPDRRTWWRTRIVRAGEVPDVLPGDGVSLADDLDRVELALLRSSDPEPVRRSVELAVGQLVARPLRPLLDGTDLRAVLRAEALLDQDVDAAVEALPPRLVGEIAMAEGELLALRLPNFAERLLARAVQMFLSAGDRTAATRAAVLYVLTVARGVNTSGKRRFRKVARQPLPDRAEWSGWPARQDRARQLLDGGPAADAASANLSPEFASWALSPDTGIPAGSVGGPAVGPPDVDRALQVPARARSETPSPGLGQLGPYHLDALIGRGAMGEVYRAHDTMRDRIVALKVLPPWLTEDPDFRERFRRELRLAAQLREAHVLPIHDFGEIDGRLYIDMRLVEGPDLARLLQEQGSLVPARAVEIVSQVAEALDAAHEAGLLHREVKPSNILLTAGVFAYLDLQVDRRISPESTLTAAGSTVSSPSYTAPELFTGSQADHRADQYALACVFYELLTGAPPFRGDGMAALIHAHISSPVPAPSAAAPGVPPALDAVVARGMAKDPDERFASAGELAEAALVALGPTGAFAYPPAPGDAQPGTTASPWPGPWPDPDQWGFPAGAFEPAPARAPTAAPSAIASARGVSDSGPNPSLPAPRRRRRVGRALWILLAAVLLAVVTWAALRSAAAPPSPGSTPPPSPGSGTSGLLFLLLAVPIIAAVLVGVRLVRTTQWWRNVRLRRGSRGHTRRPRSHRPQSRPGVPNPPGTRRPVPTGQPRSSTPPTSRPTGAGSYAVTRDGADAVLTPDGPVDPRRPYRVVPLVDPRSSAYPGPERLIVHVPDRPREGQPLRWRLPEWPPSAGDVLRRDFVGPPQLQPDVTGGGGRRRHLLHLVGTPVPTRAGWRLRVRGSSASTPGDSPFELPEWSLAEASEVEPQGYAQQRYEDHGYGQQTRGVFVGEQLLGPDDILDTPVVLAVLQADPTDRAQPLGRLAEGMYALATELRDGGAGAVLVVPPLPDRLARTVVEAAARAASDWFVFAHAVNVLDLAHEIQYAITDTRCQVQLFTSARPERTS